MKISNKRKLFANVKIDARGKKQVNLGKKWGSLTTGNTEAIKTGDGLWVIDIDTKNMKDLPKEFRKLLPPPTISTNHGFHYYFKGEGIPQTQALIDKVDIRNEGGLVFSEYHGDDDRISYSEVGEIHKPSKALMRYLKTASGLRIDRTAKNIERNYVKGKKIKQFKDGEHHDSLMSVAIKMMNDRASDDEVFSRLNEYRENYLSGDGFSDRHEKKLMQGRFDWAKTQIGNNKIKGKTLDRSADKPKTKTKKKKKGKSPAWRDIALENGAFDQASADKVKEAEYIGFIGKGHTTILYGSSGTMKTSIMVLELAKELLNRPELEIFFYSFDASELHHKAVFEYLKKHKVQDRFHILDASTPAQLLEMIEQAVDDGSDLSNAVFLIDTYKKVVGDINNKAKNAEIMQEFKSITKLGATLAVISHSNKDGENHSGTQELEGDSDALIKFEAHTDATGTFIAITQAGRIRYEFEPLSYFIANDGSHGYLDLLMRLEKLDSFVSTDNLAKQAKDFYNDKEDINKICDIISSNECTKDDILMLVTSDTNLSKFKAERLLKDYEGKKWRINKKDAYKLIKVLKHEDE